MAMPPDGPAGGFPADPADPWPSSRAEIFIYLEPYDIPDRSRNGLFGWLRRLGPAKAGRRLADPGAEADQMPRTLKRD